jgi:hypothetical protein
MYRVDPFAMLVGRVGQVGQAVAPPGMMVPAPPATAIPMPPSAWPYGPALGNCNFPCYPLPDCEPQSAGFYRHAVKAAVASQAPQTALPVNSFDITPGTAIGAGLSRTLSTSPTVPFCITNLRVTRTSSPFFDITSITAARVEYLTDGGGVPADDFSPDANTPPLQMPMLFPGTQISLTARNVDSADHHFRGSYYGFPGPSCSPCL